MSFDVRKEMFHFMEEIDECLHNSEWNYLNDLMKVKDRHQKLDLTLLSMTFCEKDKFPARSDFFESTKIKYLEALQDFREVNEILERYK